jgi:hypothetical protein
MAAAMPPEAMPAATFLYVDHASFEVLAPRASFMGEYKPSLKPPYTMPRAMAGTTPFQSAKNPAHRCQTYTGSAESRPTLRIQRFKLTEPSLRSCSAEALTPNALVPNSRCMCTNSASGMCPLNLHRPVLHGHRDHTIWLPLHSSLKLSRLLSLQQWNKASSRRRPSVSDVHIQITHVALK